MFNPPKKSTYGDYDFTEDTWSQNTTAPPAPPPTYPPSGMRGQVLSPVHSRTPNPNLNVAPGSHQPHQNQGSIVDLTKNITNSITQEDILFLRGWQRDSFYYRVLPLTSACWGALYMYNKTKQLPHKFGRYFLVGSCAYLVAKFSYRSEFRRRIAENRSNSAYMQAMRRAIGLEPIVPTDGFDRDPGLLDHGSGSGFDSSNWNTVDPNDISHNSEISGRGLSPHLAYGQTDQDQIYQPFESENRGLEFSKQAATYEELRARNRGIIK